MLKRLAVFTTLLSVATAAWSAGEPIRIALIEQMSGPFANIGLSAKHAFDAEFSALNEKGGVLGRQLELVPFDSHGNPQDAALQVQAASDQNIRYVIQGSGSNLAHAILDAVVKHNARSPDDPIVYLNHGALDPTLTEEKCSFWHFRFVPHGHMIVSALTDAIASDKRVRQVYLINQDYAWGRSVAADARSMLAARRPDIRVVGEDLHPIGKVKDFASYVAKAAAAKADTIITGNWGNDLALLIRAIRDAGLQAEIYAPLAGLKGAPTSIGEAGADRVKAVLFWHENVDPNTLIPFAMNYRARYDEDWNWLPNVVLPEMLARAMVEAGTTNPASVARALEGLRYPGPTGEIWMRPDDHQIMMPMFQTIFTKAGVPGVKYDAEKTGFGWKTQGKVDTGQIVSPVLCKVERP
ncbi:MAG TPA: branched-chain amino acid ABC transporter substrate-binding protein [Burkholderiales bacterium]|nr:branched-chain amino acid ABC transporter substrate-binding protein [Burkholderiales bacterium]